MRLNIWNGKNTISVNGRLLKFPFAVSDKPSIQLFKSGRKWWIYYTNNNVTGHFKSKKEAVEWIERGGR